MITRHVILVMMLGLPSILGLSGCLKTRAQVRGEEPAEPTPQRVQKTEASSYAVDEIKAEITRLTGRIDELERNQTKPGDDDRVQKLESRIVELENAQLKMLEALKGMEGKLPPPDQTDRFQKGLDLYRLGQFEEAIKHFTTYLENPNGRFKEDALFFRAESYFQTKNFKKAIVDYSKFPESYQKSERLPQALWKVGLSFEALGMKDDAQAFYQEVVDKFPKTTEGKNAKQKLLGTKKKRI